MKTIMLPPGTLPKSNQLYLARHGLTPANRARYLPGREEPLVDEGKLQALRMGHELKEMEIHLDHVLCSGTHRTMETANLILMDTRQRPVLEVVNEFEEKRPGKSVGYSIVSKGQSTLELLLSLEGIMRFNGGETISQFCNRIATATEQLQKELQQNRYGNILLVGHGLANRVIIGTLLRKLGKQALQEFSQLNGELICLKNEVM